ncbi:uncharacterized protein TM35_000012780 [Trypanosoma theileri]|uniref:PH domain-containing protein n=1 Tax=Trypanosoma theileri TaxID=67003 RepID=A0A1X0P993_9TRYP|nr:uncharacterized protein TM35_000012780 [Trypanosoma theileri]ORC93401.1 hypothetical protein TM35_000012780 [Trypanosoma theileri]
MNILHAESEGRFEIIAAHAAGLTTILKSLHSELSRLLMLTNVELRISHEHLADARRTIRALRTSTANSNNNSNKKEISQERFPDEARVREELRQQREENKRLLLAMKTQLPFDKSVVLALADSYENELERLRRQIGMMRENYIDNQISDAWLKNELGHMKKSVSPSKHTDVKLNTTTTNATTNIDENNDCIDVYNTSRPSFYPFRGRSSMDRNSKSVSCPRIDTSHSLEKEKVIWQDYVSLKVTRHWSRLYCVLSQSGTLLFFDNADDVSQSRHIIFLHSVKRIRPVSSPPQLFAVQLEYNKEAGGYHVEIAFAGKTERSLWMVLLHSQLNLRVDNNH